MATPAPVQISDGAAEFLVHRILYRQITLPILNLDTNLRRLNSLNCLARFRTMEAPQLVLPGVSVYTRVRPTERQVHGRQNRHTVVRKLTYVQCLRLHSLPHFPTSYAPVRQSSRAK